MGVEHYIVCGQCKEYIDLHKAYEFSMVATLERPSPGIKGHFSPNSNAGDIYLRGTYWESRGLWFLWKHRGHSGVEMWKDHSDEWFDLEPTLKEVYPHSDDLKIRETK